MAVNTVDKLQFYHLYLLFYYQFIALTGRLGGTIMHQHTKKFGWSRSRFFRDRFFYIFQMAIGHHVEFLKA